MDIYHVLNRGVEKRNLFLDSQDYARFVHELYEFNDTRPADNLHRRFDSGMKDLRGLSFSRLRERLVDIHSWCLMKNHYHILLSERIEGGISKFLMKVNVGYAKYFNERYKRNGTLFQGRTKKILVEHDAHFNYLLHYVHFNPLDYLPGASAWRERDKGRIADVHAALEYLADYRWSSYLDYCGHKNFPSLITTRLFSGGIADYSTAANEYLLDHSAASVSYERYE